MLKRKIFLGGLIVFTILLLGGCTKISEEQSKETTENNKFIIGALLDLTGDWSSLGQDSKITLELANKDINDYFKSINSNLEVEFIIEDTAGNPEKALEKIKVLKEKQAKFIIGPQASSEVKAIKDYADANDIIVISQGSTAHSLAYAQDNIFRFVTDDMNEGKEVSKLMWDKGIRTVIPMWRDDAGNGGLQIAIDTNFKEAGGTILEGVKYESGTKNFKKELEKLNTTVKEAISLESAEKIAIYLAAFDEVVEIFNQAKKYSDLSKVKWYGSNGVALSEALINNKEAAEFAIKALYPCPINAEGKTESYQEIKAIFYEAAGRNPDAYAVAAYDAAWVITNAYNNTADKNNFNELKQEFIKTADSYIGATGPTTLNDAGDRELWGYDFWIVVKDGDKYKWQLLSQ